MNKWHQRFMERAMQVASWSKDPDHKVGAVIVDENHFQISEGYNGPPMGVVDSNLEREHEVLRTLHAELNALLLAKESVKGAFMYVYPFAPCAQCAAAIIQKGLKKVIYLKRFDLPNWKSAQIIAEQMFEEAGVEIICYEEVSL